MCMRAQVCVLIGELVERLMTGHYILVSSASVLWVRSTAALAPGTPYHSIIVLLLLLLLILMGFSSS